MNIWNSRRSCTLSQRGICASSQSIASSIGIEVLRSGGNAADAAVAMAAALNVTEPCSTGIGGDAFALYYDANTNQVSCLQGNGASPQALSLEEVTKRGFQHPSLLPASSALCITVPGAAMLWEDLILQHGQLSLKQVLQPAIRIAKTGFPIGAVTAEQWNQAALQGEESFKVFKPTSTIQHGQIFYNPDLAHTFELLGELGAKKGFYSGAVGDAIIETIAAYHGVMTSEDLLAHQTIQTNPISIVYKGIRIYQTPPPSHGIAVLIALLLIQAYEDKFQPEFKLNDDVDFKELYANFDINWALRRNTDQLHIIIECMRCAYADALQFVADPEYFIRSNATSEELCQKLLPGKVGGTLNYQQVIDTLINTPAYIESRLSHISSDHVSNITAGDMTPFLHGETVYFNVVDEQGNACSFINSNFQGFGSGITPKGCGFTLQNRGFNFSLDPNHVNCVGPRKRPYHTIIPGLGTFASDDSFYAVFGNMVSSNV